ncbi:S-glutathionyl-(chloro)hydroquinone reductase [Xylographa vitiligo]|nr:S-glutathionyl-(chloro)hydroquinone reductase [Xylographa vitiligo]
MSVRRRRCGDSHELRDEIKGAEAEWQSDSPPEALTPTSTRRAASSSAPRRPSGGSSRKSQERTSRWRAADIISTYGMRARGVSDRTTMGNPPTHSPHRALIVRKLKGLEHIVPFTCVHWHLELNVDKNKSWSWRFATAEETVPEQNMRPDPIQPTGRYTVPLLYDTKTDQVVSNESSQILRKLYTEFDELLPAQYAEVDLFLANLRVETEETNDWIYHHINNGVYKSGASMKQEAYVEAVTLLFAALDRAEAHLTSSPGPFYYGSQTSPRPMSACTSPWCVSIPCTTSTSSATSGTFARAILLSTSGCDGFIGVKMPSRARPTFSKSKIPIQKAI